MAGTNKFFYQYLPGILLLVIVVYANSIGGGFVSDDIPVIAESRTIGTWAGVFAQPHVFMRDFLYFILFNLFGANPAVYHLLNLIFHAGSVCLLFIILNTLYSRNTAVIASVLFAVHPAISESVSWISGGAYAQYSFFLLASFYFFILHQKEQSNRRHLVLSMLFFLCGLLSSDKAIIFPVLLFLYSISCSHISRLWKKIIPFFVFSLIWGSIYLFQFTERISYLNATFGDTAYISNPLIFMATAVSGYLRLLVWPDMLTIYHSEFVLNSFNNVLNLGIFFLYICVLVFTFFKNRPVFFWLSFFIVSLGVMLLPLRISWIVAERYMYLGSAGIFTVAGIGFDYLLRRKRYSGIIIGVFIIIISSFIIRTVIRNRDWRNEEHLWTATVKTTPSNPVARSSLGIVYRKNGEIEKAMREFQKSVSLNPDYAEGYYQIADVYRTLNNLEAARKFYQKSVDLNPALWQGYQALGAVYYLQKNYSQAIRNTQTAINFQKNNAELYVNLGIMQYESGDAAGAGNSFQEALRIDPENLRALQAFQKVQSEM